MRAFYQTPSMGHLFTEMGGTLVLFTEPCPRGASSLKRGDAGAFYQTPSTGCLFAETGDEGAFYRTLSMGRFFPETGTLALFTEPRPRALGPHLGQC